MVPVVARHRAGARGDARAPARARPRRDVVIEGRDIGTVVAPGAEVKVYLVADREVRAKRRTRRRVPAIGARRARHRPALARREATSRGCAGARRARRSTRRASRSTTSSTRIEALVRAPPAGVTPQSTFLGDRARDLGLPRAPASARLRVYGQRTDSATRRRRACDQPLLLDRRARSFGFASSRTTYFVAKAEAAEIPGLGQFIRTFGTFAVRRGESDREAVRRMREVVRTGTCSALFVEGTRQQSGRSGRGAAGRGDGRGPGERAGRLPARSTARRSGSSATSRRAPVAWGEPLRFDGLPRGAGTAGYRGDRYGDPSGSGNGCATCHAPDGCTRCRRARRAPRP